MTRSGRMPRVIMMTRLPVPGCAKTRLAAVIGEIEAAHVQSSMGRLLTERLRALEAAGDACLEVHFTGGSLTQARRWLGRGPNLRLQQEGDLGARLSSALHGALARGATAAVLMGSDCPAVTPEHVREALRSLSSGADVVIGPATDGGYWLLGVHSRFARQSRVLFDGIEWGAASVFHQTVQAAHLAGATVELLPVLGDVDRADDLHVLEDAMAEEQRARDPISLSVVIPTLNEAGTIADAIDAALRSGADEVIVADGGSDDATREIAQRRGARTVVSPVGRAVQMNFGARAAGGDALLFLHADCVLPPGAAASALTCLKSGAVAGAFSFGTDSARRRDQWAASAGRLRHRATGYSYGDQGLFLSARTFNDLGGFPSLPVMEDWEMVRRLRHMGDVRILPLTLSASPRGWQQHGLVLSTLVNAAVIAGYRLGVRPSLLAALRRTVAARHSSVEPGESLPAREPA